MTTSTLPIKSQFNQLALSHTGNAGNGTLLDDQFNNVVIDIDDINQCISVILTTPKGSDPLRPTFGSNCHDYIDYPVNTARPHLVREIVDALNAWEPRISIIKVTVNMPDIAAFNVAITWQFANGITLENFVTNLVLGVSN